jgi:spore germination protein
MNGRVLATKQVGRLLLGYTVGGTILALPTVTTAAFGTSAWWMLLIYGLVFTLGGWLTARLASKFPEETLVEFGAKILGNPLNWLINLFLIAMFLAVVPMETRLMVEIATIAVLPNAPSWFISGFFLLVVTYSIVKGLDTFAQINEILIIASVLIGAAVVILGWQNADLTHLLPLFYLKDFKLQPDLLLTTSFAFFGYPILLYLAPFLKEPRRMTAYTIRTLIFIAILFAFFTFTVLSVFGAKETLNQGWPALELAKSINIPGIFIERLDLVLILSWIPAIFTTAACSFYFGVLGIVRLFKIKNASAIIWTLAIVFFFASGSLTNFFMWNRITTYLSYAAIVISLGIPFFLWIAYLIRPNSKTRNGRGGGQR